LDVTQHSVSREVATFFALPPGEYVIIPQTKIPNCEAKFLLRILTDEQSTIWYEIGKKIVLKDTIRFASLMLCEFVFVLTGR